jgi:hypothetical protein
MRGLVEHFPLIRASVSSLLESDMNKPTDDRQRGEATQAWRDTQSGKAAVQAIPRAIVRDQPPALKLDLPAPAIGTQTRAMEDRDLAVHYARLTRSQGKIFADRAAPDLVASKERDQETQRGQLKSEFDRAKDAGMEK